MAKVEKTEPAKFWPKVRAALGLDPAAVPPRMEVATSDGSSRRGVKGCGFRLFMRERYGVDFLANDAGGVLTGDDLPNGRTPKRALSALASAPADASDVSSNTPVSGGRIMVDFCVHGGLI